MNHIPLIPLGQIQPDRTQAILYPGEAQYLALVPGLRAEVWYDDGRYTGLAGVELHHILTQQNTATYLAQVSHHSDTWLLLDRGTGNLFMGGSAAVSAHLQRNVHPIIQQGREHSPWQELFRY